MKKHLDLQVMTAKVESHRVDEEGAIFLEDRDHAATRQLLRQAHANPPLAPGTLGSHPESVASDRNEAGRTVGLQGASGRALEKGVGERTEARFVPAERPRLGLDG